MTGLVIDNFAGGGGASTGIEQALGRAVDIAINHDEAAIAVHTANHPGTKHFCQSIYSVDPLEATGGERVRLVWFSPDCKHHSKAKGGKPRDKNIRDLAWVVPHWIERLQSGTPGGVGAPDVIYLENVEEFRQWGPLDPVTFLPIKERRGEEFQLWVRRIRLLGYNVAWWELRACDYGEPTSRKRLYLVARRDGKPIVKPVPTHGPPDSADVRSGKLLPFRTAAECIDWSIPCRSIFGRKRPLKDATNRRVAAGVMRYVVNSSRPFIVPITHTGSVRVHSADEPLRTVTTARRGELAIAVPHIASMANREKPFTAADEPMHTVTATGCKKVMVAGSLAKLRNHSDGEDPREPLGAVTAGGQHHAAVAATLVQTGYGERDGQEPRALDLDRLLGTVVAGGAKHAAVAAFLHKYRPNSDGSAADAPMPTVTANSFVKRSGGAPPLAVTAAHLEQANTGMVGHEARKPLSTIVGKGCTQRLVETTLVEEGALPPDMMAKAARTAAFLVKYYGSEVGQHQSLDSPIDTVTAKPRFAVVTVTIDAVTFVLVDIGMRMLEPRELANAMGLPADYVLDPVCWYRTDKGNLKYGPLPKSHQIAKIGNMVCPGMARALVAANSAEADEQPERAAA